MTFNWAAQTDVGLDVLGQVQSSLPVHMIMTPRKGFMTCNRDETEADVAAKNDNYYSFLPVVDDGDKYIGLYNAEAWFGKDAPETLVSESYEPFSEDLVIGADASIFGYMKVADRQPTRLVVSGHQVAGLISLSDLQTLPVRAALFSLITGLEITMARRIEHEFPDDASAWMRLISEERQKKLQVLIKNARQVDTFVSEIAYSQFCDKATIVRKSKFLSGLGNDVRHDFKIIERLRNDIAHAKNYAQSPDKARAVCRIAHRIFEIKAELISSMGTKAAPVAQQAQLEVSA